MTAHVLNAAMSVVLWTLVLWRAYRARAFTSLWWSTLAFAIALTLRTPYVAQSLESCLGTSRTPVIGHLALVVALGLTARWLLTVHYGTATPPHWHTLLLCFAAAATIMTVAGLRSVPAAALTTLENPTIPRPLFDLAFAGAFAVCLLLACGAIIASSTAAFTLAQVRYRVSLGCIGAAAACFWLYAAFTCYIQIAALSGMHWPLPSPVVTDSFLTCALLSITTALALPLLLPRSGRRRDVMTIRTVTALWEWLSPAHPPLAIDEQATVGGVGVSDATSALLDRIWRLQHWVNPQQLAAATATARSQGLAQRRATLVAVVNCLEEALTSERLRRPTERRVADLLPTTGTGRFEAELKWLMDLAATRGLPRTIRTGRRPNSQPVAPAIPALADPDLLAQCEQHLERWLPGQPPTTVTAIVGVISRKLGQRIHIVIGDAEGLPLPIALWLGAPNEHLIWVDKHTTPMQRTISLLHEIGHIICGHTPTPVATTQQDSRQQLPDPVAALSTATPRSGPVLAYRGRDLGTSSGGCSSVDDRIEAEAELTGRLLASHLLHAPDAALAAYLDEG
ncbi:ImmA/IrrE family metallo-endopeptidase [Pseudonocardia spinosispora]|uniref:ImmA/IrrE family metallo-endopeptidase n=1 Tax=Pseudonocardia spinosispora TaxID=103441 RepID=UPI00041932F4|nr:ImmA/IrrE family metallo-endopeptidase [Pseudonocardia spinosispora]